jgi:hypothetical protein
MPEEHKEPPAGLYEVHQLANVYPRMDEETLKALAADIDAHGLKQPIVMFENKVLDGRNRVMAYAMSERGKKAKGVIPAPLIRTFKGSCEEAEQLVFALNMMRRHLKVGQRAMLGLIAVTTKHGGVERFAQERNPSLEVTYADAAKKVGVSVDSIKTAAAVRAYAEPKIVEQVRRGQMSLNAAYDIVRPKAEAEEVEPEAYADISGHGAIGDEYPDTGDVVETASGPQGVDKRRAAERRVERETQAEPEPKPGSKSALNVGPMMLEMRMLGRNLSAAQLAVLIADWIKAKPELVAELSKIGSVPIVYEDAVAWFYYTASEDERLQFADGIVLPWRRDCERGDALEDENEDRERA